MTDDNQKKNIILGSGIAGLSAGFHLKNAGGSSIIFEKDSDWGGLCGFFEIEGFRFDRFVHFSSTKDREVEEIFTKNTPFIAHEPISSNYYKGYWLKHPAQNNLHPLKWGEKFKIISDFLKRPKKDISEIKDYETWLRCQYGNYFAQKFPMEYTKKYWGTDAKNLETKWVGNRMHCPSLKEMLQGAIQDVKKIFYYANVMRYPEKGGFRSFFNDIREGLDIRLNKEAVKIRTENKEVSFSDGSVEKYDNLISSMPLPEIIKIIDNVPQEIQESASKLCHTCGYMVSLGFNKPDIAKHLWFYVYDEDIPFARVYSPSLKSPDNAPAGCSSLQAEVFYGNNAKISCAEEILQKTIDSFIKMGICDYSDIVVRDIRFEKYANIMFDHDIYKNRKIVLDYLNSKNIISIGRFGKWDYLWSDQAFRDGNVVSLIK